ncbi:MAG: DNA-processing protein DprA [Rubrivivax sp.]|nr:DNA-processing protein DprA [Rubrivivax sp.]
MPQAAPDAPERAAWLRLLLTEGVGRDTARRLLAAFGDPREVLAASPSARRQVAGAAAEALQSPPAQWETHLAAMEAWLAAGPARMIWTLGDPAYPAALLQTPDPPLLLFAQGDPAVLSRPALAIVGSRNATAQGLDNARAFARHLSEAGWAIVSGLARGIDAAAHEGALLGDGGTIAVVGTGPDRVYPSAHRALAHRIVERGLILSEYAPGTPPLPLNFPLRNRLIAALSQGTLVVEAALQSGSLITARLAAEAGREVFAVPGSIHAPQSRGCHALIRQGAKLVETAQDILEELAPQLRPVAAASGAAALEPADPLLDALGNDPVTLDALSARTGWPIANLNVRLLELELDGLVARLPGGLFQRRHAG